MSHSPETVLQIPTFLGNTKMEMETETETEMTLRFEQASLGTISSCAMGPGPCLAVIAP